MTPSATLRSRRGQVTASWPKGRIRTFRRLDLEDQTTEDGAVQEMEEPGPVGSGGPPRPLSRRRPQTTRDLLRSRTVVVSIAGEVAP